MSVYTPDELREIANTARASTLAQIEIQKAFEAFNEKCYREAYHGAFSYTQEYNDGDFKYVTTEYALREIAAVLHSWGFVCKCSKNTLSADWEGKPTVWIAQGPDEDY